MIRFGRASHLMLVLAFSECPIAADWLARMEAQLWHAKFGIEEERWQVSSDWHLMFASAGLHLLLDVRQAGNLALCACGHCTL